MNIFDFVEDVERRTYTISNEKDLLAARKNFLSSLISNPNSAMNKLDPDDRFFLIQLLEKELLGEQFERTEQTRNMILKLSSDDEKERSKISNLLNQYENLLEISSVTDSLERNLAEQKGMTFYYIGINQFVLDYYNKNPDSEWKIKAILQMGFPFDFGETKSEEEEIVFLDNLVKHHLKNKKWSLFIFAKEQFDTVILGFDDRNKFAKLDYINSQKCYDVCDVGLPKDYRGTPVFVENLDHYDILCDFLESNKIQKFTNTEKERYEYSFMEIPSEFFRIDYLDYLSRYKESVIEVFGYPGKNEKILKFKNNVEFINAPGKKRVELSYEDRKQNVFIKDFYIQNNNLRPFIRIGAQVYDDDLFWEQYEIHSYLKNITPYYLYCLLSSEFVADYYLDRYDDTKIPLPLEDCIYFEIEPSKINNKKYFDIYMQDINPRLKVYDMINSSNFRTVDAKETLKDYLREIKNDIDAGAYYSATIVMGSVLEAFLIDWLSEIDGKNYFKEDYIITDQKYNYQKRADLMDYINIIQKKRPDWIDGARKATEIRKIRNLVHAKLYIEKGAISQEICYEMLNNLEVIIDNRWNKK